MKFKFAGAALIASILVLVSVPGWGAEAAKTYKSKCTVCHGADGSGDTVMGKKLGAPSLKSEQVRKAPDAELAAVVTNGKNKMPAYDKALSQEEIAALVTYIRTLK